MLARCLALLSLAGVIALHGTGLDAQPAAAPPSTTTTATTATTAAAAAAPRSPRNASYAITARLDPASRTLKGDELLTWRNLTATPARTLRFHLYYNAWRNSASTWMRERRLAGDSSGMRRPQTDWGWIEVTSVRVIGSGGTTTDLTHALRAVAPDDGNVDDATVAELPLETAVEPGQAVNVQIAWSARVPRTFARTGVIGNDYFLAQWFPKIAVLEDSGWNSHQFHAGTEFFADFGVYDVRLTVPNGWVVGATGTERGRRDEGDGTTTHHYYAEDVHDFAWTTSPAYVERTGTFEHPRLPPVSIRLLLQPEHLGQAERHFEATRATLKYYGEWFGPYPYGQITVVDPAWQSGFDGMEYPTLITAGTRWLAPRRVDDPEGVTVHEAGHQWWYGVVATNEFEHAWMDEGLNTFATARVLEQFFSPVLSKRYFGGFIPWTFPDFALLRSTDGNRLAGYRLAAQSDAQDTPSFRYWPQTGGAITYNKTALWLNTLERLIGWDTVQRILSTYFTRYRFAHPGPREFFAVANEVSGQDLTWFFDQVYTSSSGFDYGIDVFTSRPDAVRGYVGEGERRRFESGSGTSGPYHTVVVARRYEDGVFPVDVRVVFENGEEVRWRWTGAERWKTFEVNRPVRAAYAQIDPERVLLLDGNYTNNSARLTADPARSAARKWSLAWLIWLQDHLLTYGFFV